MEGKTAVKYFLKTLLETVERLKFANGYGKFEENEKAVVWDHMVKYIIPAADSLEKIKNSPEKFRSNFSEFNRGITKTLCIGIKCDLNIDDLNQCLKYEEFLLIQGNVKKIFTGDFSYGQLFENVHIKQFITLESTMKSFLLRKQKNAVTQNLYKATSENDETKINKYLDELEELNKKQ